MFRNFWRPFDRLRIFGKNFEDLRRANRPDRLVQPARPVLHCPPSLPCALAGQTTLRAGQAATEPAKPPPQATTRPDRANCQAGRASSWPSCLPASQQAQPARLVTQPGRLVCQHLFLVCCPFLRVHELRLSILCLVCSVSFRLCQETFPQLTS